MKTESFDAYLENELESAEFRKHYLSELGLIQEIDRFVNELDSARKANHLTKEFLAERIGVNGSQIRRLFSSSESNPTMKSFLAIANVLGLEIQLVSSSAKESTSA